jgi:L-ascorbate metabolism protein UlaG (beta-lactamase superfamily)
MSMMRKKTSSLTGLLLLSTGIVALLFMIGCRPFISLGKNPVGEDLKRIERLPNYRNGQFHNLEAPPSPPPGNVSRRPRWTGFLKLFLGKPQSTLPRHRIEVPYFNLKSPAGERPEITWFGHSSFLLKTKSGNILVDPNFSGFAGPFKGLVNAFHGSDAFHLKDLPPIDVLLISHDHYDHLDYKSVMQLRKKVRKVVVPAGVGSHLRHWGFDPSLITELAWNDSILITNNLRIIATPAHHRSNRTFDQRKTLWASYVIRADGYNIYFSGDTGYSKHFRLIGEQYGPFDLALIECGQYNTRWPYSHLFPWQTARAAQDVRASLLIPIHWAKFAESTHSWNEPIKLLHKSADSLNQPVYTPYIGQPYTVGEPYTKQRWWNRE